MKRLTRWFTTATMVGTLGMLAASPGLVHAASNPAATQVTLKCGVMGSLPQKGAPDDGDDEHEGKCEHLRGEGHGKSSVVNGRLEWYSGGVLVFTEMKPLVLSTSNDEGAVTLLLSGNGDAATFRKFYADAGSSIFTAPDLTVKVIVSDCDGKGCTDSLVLFQKYAPVGSAMWSQHSEDSAGLQAAIDAEAAARKAVDLTLFNSLSAEASARKQGDSATFAAATAYTDNAVASEASARAAADSAIQLTLANAITAEASARAAGDATALTSAIAYTDAHTPWPQTCPVGQVPVSTGPGKWSCGAGGGGGLNLACVANQLPVSDGHGGWTCGNLCGNTITNVTTDTQNCGSCGNVCNAANATSTCVAGACGYNGCNANFADCNQVAADGCEVSLLTDANNCAQCGHACGQGFICNKGNCEKSQFIGQISGTQSNTWARSPFHSGMTADAVTGKYYFWPGYAYDGATIYEYPDESSLINNVNGRAIAMPTQYEGTYHASHNGFLYYNTFQTNTLVKVRASDGTIVTSSASLPNAGHTNQSYFNWGGYSDICFEVDNGNLYVMWATPNGGNMNVSLLDQATLAVTTTVTVPRSKQSLGWAFIAQGIVYMSSNYSDPHMSATFDLNSQVYNPNYANSLTPMGDYVTDVYYNQAKNELLVHTNGTNVIYPNIFH